MEKTSATLSALVAQCRIWSREAEETWFRLNNFVEQVGDFLRVREAGGWIPQELPEDSHVVAELARWQLQRVMGMGSAQICDNTVTIAHACRVFLFAGELDPHALPAELKWAFEALLECTRQVETSLLVDPLGDPRSRRLELLAQSMHRYCEKLPRPAKLSMSRPCRFTDTLSNSGGPA